MSAIRLTITARDAAHARAILEAVERIDHAGILVQPDDTGAPTGHTYRELNDARRDGLLVAEVTAKGILLTEAALADYRQVRAERRRRKRPSSNVADMTEHRIRALESAGIKVR